LTKGKKKFFGFKGGGRFITRKESKPKGERKRRQIKGGTLTGLGRRKACRRKKTSDQSRKRGARREEDVSLRRIKREGPN